MFNPFSFVLFILTLRLPGDNGRLFFSFIREKGNNNRQAGSLFFEKLGLLGDAYSGVYLSMH